MNKSMVLAALIAVGGVARAQGDPLEAAATAQVAAQAPGAVQVAPFFKGADKKTDYSILLENGKCYWFSGVSGGDVKKLALYLWGPGAGVFTLRLADAKSNSGNATLA